MGFVKALYRYRAALGWAAILGAVVWFGSAPLGRLRARLPDPLNANRHITVVTDAEDPPAAGTPLIRLSPRLEVLGVVEGRAEGARTPGPHDVALRVSLFPEAEQVVRDDAEIVLRESTPDLLEIVTTWLTPERRAVIAARLQAFYREHERAIDAMLARAKQIADRELGADELGRRLAADPVLREAVGGAIQQEITSKIDWDGVVERTLRSDAADTAGQLAGEAPVFRSAWAGMREGYAARWRSMWSDEDLPPEEGDLDGLLSPFNFFVPRWHDARRAAVGRAAENILEAYPGYREELARESKALALELAREEQLEKKGFAAVRALGRSEGFREAIVRRHGPEAWARVQRFSAALAQDEAMLRLSRRTIDSGLQLFAAFLRQIALDEEGKGPNPLLVAFVRARLLRKVDPVLIVETTGVGEPAAAGKVFVSRTR